MKILLGLGAAAGLATGAYALWGRPRIRRWGATEEELRARSRAADLIPDARRSSVMAVTVDAPPSAVWPWLVQMGYGRAGWYSWDRLDNFGNQSARSLHPEWQSLSVGERLPSTPDGKHWFDVAAVEPERFLALRVLMSGGRQRDPAEPRPPAFTDSLWAFELEELPGDRTRLVVTVHLASRPQRSSVLPAVLFWEPAHFIMQLRQFANLKRRAEGRLQDGAGRRASASAAPELAVPHHPAPGVH